MLSSPRRMKLHGSIRMGWIQRRQCVLPPPCPAALTPCCQFAEGQGRWPQLGCSPGTWVDNVHSCSPTVLNFIFSLLVHMCAENNCASARLKGQPSDCTAESPSWFFPHHSTSLLISPQHFFFLSNSGNQ